MAEGRRSEKDRGGEARERASRLSISQSSGDRSRGLGTDHDLRRPGQILELDDSRGRGAGDEQLTVRTLGQEEVDGAAVHAGGHPQFDLVRRARRRADLLDRPLHVGGRARTLGRRARRPRRPGAVHRRGTSTRRRRGARPTSISAAKIPEIVRTSSSAPSRPLPASRSDRAVKPEMSTDTREPSRLRARGASRSVLQPRTRRGRYEASSVR